MEFEIEEMNLNELHETLKLVKEVFDEFELPDYSQEGIKTFYEFSNYNNILKNLNCNLKIFVAKSNSKIVGMIAIRDLSHIAMLFVDKKYHRKGIAKALIEKIKELTISDIITVNSSPYAIDFYHKMGFENIENEKIDSGIRFTPMKLKKIIEN